MKDIGRIVNFKDVSKRIPSQTPKCDRISMNNLEWIEEEYAEAFAWALDLQKLNGWHSEPVNLIFEKGDLEESREHGCILSLFIDRETDRVILRRDWPEDMCLKYSKLMNFKELSEKIPEDVEKMLQNGLELYHKEGAKYFKALYLTHRKELKGGN